MGALDPLAKVLLHEAPEAFARLALGHEVVIRKVRADDTELPALSRRMDRLVRVEVDGEDEPCWIHVEVQASWKSDVPRRVFEYWSMAHRRRPKLLSLVICLARGVKQGDPRGAYDVVVRGRRRLLFEFDVVRVWEDLQAEHLLANGPPGLLPLLPYTAGASEQLVDRGLRVLSEVSDDHLRRELRVALVTLAERAFTGGGWLGKIAREELMESTTWKEIGEQFRLEGRRELLAELLSERLGAATAARFLPRLRPATEETLAQVGKLLAGRHPDLELADALDRSLPPEARDDS